MEPLSTAVPGVVRSLLSRGPMSAGKFEFAWRVAVGPAIERVSKPRLREDGTAEVEVADATWRREVKRSQAVILARLQKLLGAAVVRKVKITGGGR